MGCVASRIDKEERVRICKERKRLMKQLLRYRKEFADAQLAYLRSLRNTGVTLRQFTESELLELDETTSGIGFPPSPPPPLPPSPPPPPTFSPDLRKFEDKPSQTQVAVEEIIEIDEHSSNTPPPPVPSSSWEYWDLFGSASPQCGKSCETAEQVEEEKWEDTNTEFVEDDEEAVIVADEVNLLQKKQYVAELIDDNSSMMSWHTKDTTDMAMVVWSKKTLTGIVKDLDEYFLKASGIVKDIAVFIDIDAGGTFLYQSIKENKRKRSSSAKVFSALTWSWSSKSLQPNREIGDFSGSGEPCKPGAHCITLQKLYLEEQKLYKDVKEEEISKVEYGRKSLLLQRQEEEHDWTKAEKTRSAFESLHSYIFSLQESIGRSSSTILMLISKELHPQLITLVSGLMHMWQTMHNCHQVQSHIAQQLSHLTDQQQNPEPTTESHQQAAGQLQTEVTSWHHSFSKLVKFQREYVRSLCKWTELTACLEDIDSTQSSNSSTVHALLEKWQEALDKLPDKMVSEAIKCLLAAVQSIVVQQQEECNLRKRSEKLGRKLERELILLSEVEMKFAGSFSIEDANPVLASKHPLTIRRAKVEALKLLVDDEKAKYVNSVKTTRILIQNNLQTSLPKVFQALMVYSSAYAHSFEVILSNATISECRDMQTATYGI
ncbi:UNVERIFIED_CONTAM: protein ALTERED PHOSPHATE STARVATION RESPONSE 1 [Sesamum angustifolium]|uniref:Protein ALTERED PHOSPHATE STARVATION RESPONSE 1 n=1 Tax=Sesamum angustifolium TaxID=2727405 RepID=A0AAW2P9H7_9LAMI